MKELLEKLNTHSVKTQKVRCHYTNQASGFQIVRIVNLPDYFFERVVCPGKEIVFEANVNSQMEVHSGSLVSAVLSDTIPCWRLAFERIKAISNNDLHRFDIHKSDRKSTLA